MTLGEPDVPAAETLLALSLALRPYISSGQSMTVIIAKTVYDALDPSVIEEILYDHLMTLDGKLDERLSIWVKPVEYVAFYRGSDTEAEHGDF